jgi:glycine cleavage system H protein
MVPALVLLMIAVCLGIEVVRSRKTRASKTPETARERADAAVPTLERLFHPGHTWVQVQDAQAVMVGIDDFAQRFMGRLDSVVLKAGVTVEQGEALAMLRHKGRELTVVAPVSGVLIEANSGIAGDPGVVNASPYERGWIARIKPSRLETEIRNLLTGAAAEKWREGLQAQMASWFAPKLGMVLQDGGEWVDNLSDLLTDEQWQELARTLFPELPPDQFNHKPVKG